MEWKDASSSKVYISARCLNKGDVIEGVVDEIVRGEYRGKSKIDAVLTLIQPLDYTHTDYKGNKPDVSHNLQAGDVVSINGTAQLAYHFNKLDRGMGLRLKYEGKIPSKNPQNEDSHSFGVQYGVPESVDTATTEEKSNDGEVTNLLES